MLGPFAVLVLVACGLAMGAINNLAGAAGALGLVGLEEAASLTPLQANASLRLSAVAIGLSGWLGFRSRGRAIPRRAWLYGAMTIPGALAGAALAITLPVWVYRTALVTVLSVVLWQQLRPPRVRPRSGAQWAAPLLFVAVGAHMGFLQVGTGLVAIAALSAVHSRDLVEVNAAKMALVICASVSATAVLALSGHVVWGPSVILALGCGAGSFLASRWAVDKGHAAVRGVVLVTTVAVLARLLWQLAFD